MWGNMKKEELKDLLEGTLEKAKELLLRDRRLVPVAFVHFEKIIDVISLSFRDNNEKSCQLSLLKKFIKEKHADAILIVAESWYVTTDIKNLRIEPSKHSMRKECIIIYGECEEGSISLMQIFDNKDGEIIFGEKIDRKNISMKFDFGINKNKQNTDLRNLN